jgi:hypothetical protein
MQIEVDRNVQEIVLCRFLLPRPLLIARKVTCDALCSRLAEQIAELEAAAAEKAAERRNSGMASVNRRNANRNFENAFKNVGARPEGARLAADGTDPFSRRKTRPMNNWTTKRTQAGFNGAPCAGSLLPSEYACLAALMTTQTTKCIMY